MLEATLRRVLRAFNINGAKEVIDLTVLGIFMIVYIPEASKTLYAVFIAIAGLGGYYIPKAITVVRSRIKHG